MRLVHLSDLHLGFRRYQRVTKSGANQREADVALSFSRAITKIIEIAPEVVVVAGDIFHSVRPNNSAIIHAVKQVQKLAEALPQTRLVMIAGNHDLPRSSDTLCILSLFQEFGATVVHRGTERVKLEALDLSILCVPELLSGDKPDLQPDPTSRYNVLLLHGIMIGAVPMTEQTMASVSARYEMTDVSTGWDYVALGHHHVYVAVRPGMYYSGSLDYVSSNPWFEDVREEREKKLPGKGFIEHDLATGKHRFHPIDGVRKHIDIGPISARGLNAEGVDALIRTTVEKTPRGIDDKVVRLIVLDLPRYVERELDHKSIREFGRRALHFRLDARRPEALRTGDANSGSPGRRPSLAETLRDRLLARPLEAGTDRERLVSLGLEYLRQADEIASPTAVDGEEDG